MSRVVEGHMSWESRVVEWHMSGESRIEGHVLEFG
jgi:hypothetical protein